MSGVLSTFAFLLLLAGMGRVAANSELLQQGQYIFFAAGCITCHTVDQPLTGGRAIDSPFGTFYTPNITPSREYGIGNWTQEDLIRALREGISPEGKHYYPAFPYPSYTKMSRTDIIALYTYLMEQPAIPKDNRPHELVWFLSNRSMIALWKQFWFSPGELQSDPNESSEWNRGEYISMALGHCGECHTPRGALGAPLMDRYLSGTFKGQWGIQAPDITPDVETGIGSWSQGDREIFLATGRKPDGSYANDLMMVVLETTCMRLTDYDLNGLALYLSSSQLVHKNLDATDDPFHDPDFYE